jgi:hypothetical protein
MIMTSNQWTGKYARLRAELAAAHGEPAWSLGRAGRIDRIVGELAEIERTLAMQRLGARLINVDESPVEQYHGSRRWAA